MMMGVGIAQVAVEQTAYHFDKPFAYSIPPKLQGRVQPGCRVLVPFGGGNRTRQAMVLSLGGETEEGLSLKEIAALVDSTPVLTREMLRMVPWLSEHCFCTLFEAARAMLPGGIGIRLQCCYVLTEEGTAALMQEDGLDAEQRQILKAVSSKREGIGREKLLSQLGFALDCDLPEKLAERGLLRRDERAVQKNGDATVRSVRLSAPLDQLVSEHRLTPKQQAVAELLDQVGEASVKEVCYFTGVGPGVISTMARHGLAELFEQTVLRNPYGDVQVTNTTPIQLNAEQQSAYDGLLADAQKGAAAALLYGVTGSGKTQVYLKLIEEMIRRGRGVIVMVPEISLTPQTLQLFHARFGDRVAVFHSGLSVGQRMDEWKRVRAGQATIAVGTRSAVFAPLEDIGLIVMDEEQEHTYKSESTPRFHARDVARFRAAAQKALLVMASATPSIESYTHATQGRYSLYKLSGRYGSAVLPMVETVDLKEQRDKGETGAITKPLREAIRQTLDAGQQAVLLHNRRGYHTFISCRSCGHVLTCPNCSISMTYHSANGRMMCHYCGRSEPVARRCPECGGEHVRFAGMGTQRVEDELRSWFPKARLLRLDADTTMGRTAFEEKLSRFAAGEYDIMLGTQMVAKGLDFPSVTLVGVVNADQALYNTDYRSYERAFALLTQVVGRAGRGSHPGRAIVQTETPDNELIQLAARQDYERFYKQEVAARRMMVYPPYCDLCLVGITGEEKEAVHAGAEGFFDLLRQGVEGEYRDVKIVALGPTPAQVSKVSNRYRYRILIKCKNDRRLRALLKETLAAFGRRSESKKASVFVDMNPEGIL